MDFKKANPQRVREFVLAGWALAQEELLFRPAPDFPHLHTLACELGQWIGDGQWSEAAAALLDLLAGLEETRRA